MLRSEAKMRDAPEVSYDDSASKLLLPQGVQLASRGRIAAVWFLGLLLFIVTAGIGYIIWSQFAWGEGRTPAQRMLSLRIWRREPARVAGRKEMALRQILGFLLNGELLCGFWVYLFSTNLRSVGDFFADTTIVYDPDGVLK